MSEAPVTVTLSTETRSGNATVHVTVHFGAHSLEEALRLIRVATDGAPMFKSPEEDA